MSRLPIKEIHEQDYYNGGARRYFEVNGKIFDDYEEACEYAYEYEYGTDDVRGDLESHGAYDDEEDATLRFLEEQESRGRHAINTYLMAWNRQIRATCELAAENAADAAFEKGMRVLTRFHRVNKDSFEEFLGSEMEKGFYTLESVAMSIIEKGIKHPADIDDKGIDLVEKAHSFIFRTAKKVSEDAWRAAVRTILMVQLVGKHERAYETLMGLCEKGKPLYALDDFLQFAELINDAEILNEEFHVAFNVYCNGDHAKFLKEVGDNTYELLEWMERYRSVKHLHPTDLDLTSRDVSVKLSQDRCTRALDL